MGFPRADAGTVSGESRMVDGDGILISSIPRRCSTFTRVKSTSDSETSEIYETWKGKIRRSR